MKFEQFEKIIKEYIKFSHYEHKLNEMGLDIVDTPLYETTGFLLDNIWEAWFNDDGIDTINWWMFEYHDLDEDFDDDLNLVQEKEPGMWDEDGNVIPMDTIEDLWNYVKDCLLHNDYTLKEVINSGNRAIIAKNTKSITYEDICDIINNPEIISALHWDDDSEIYFVPANTPELKDILGIRFKDPQKIMPFETLDGLKMTISSFWDKQVGPVYRLTYQGHDTYIWEG